MKNINTHTNKIALIAGNGKLPVIVANQLLQQKREFIILCFDEKNLQYFKQTLNFTDDDKIVSITLSNITQILSILKQQKVKQIVCCGGVKFKGLNNLNIFNLKFVISHIVLAKYLFQALLSRQKGDNFLLVLAEKMLNKLNCEIIAVQDILPNLLSTKNDEKNIHLSTPYLKDAEYGSEILTTISKFDIGQSIVICDRRVLGIEGAEGTQRLIKRCGDYYKEISCSQMNFNKKPVLIKTSKINQNKKLDVPTIGKQTIIDLIENNFAGIFLEKNAVFIIDREEIAQLCEARQFFLKTI